VAQSETGILVKMGLDPRGYQSGARAVEGATDRMARSGEAGRAVMGKFQAAILALGSGATIRALSNLTSAAEETRSKFEVVFRGVTREADAMVASMRTRLGRSKTDLEAWTAQLQDTFVPMGFAREEAQKMSGALVELGVDLASFNNAADAETINLLTSAIVGNHEAVRRFGIIITQARLDQQLLAMGFKESSKGATEQDKIMARLAIIYGSTSDAQGDAERTSDSFANTMKRLNSEVKDAATQIGFVLNQAFLQLIDAMGGAKEVGVAIRDVFAAIAIQALAVTAELRVMWSLLKWNVTDFFAPFREIPAIADEFQDAVERLAAPAALDAYLESGGKIVKLNVPDAAKRAAKSFADIGTAANGAASEVAGVADAAERFQKAMDEIQKDRDAAAGDFQDRIFEMGMGATDDPSQQIGLIHQRIAALRQQANVAVAGQDFAGQRDALMEIADLIERLNQVEGGEFVGLRQMELAGIANEVRVAFEGQTIAEQQALVAEQQRVAMAEQLAASIQAQNDAMNSLVSATQNEASAMSSVAEQAERMARAMQAAREAAAFQVHGLTGGEVLRGGGMQHGGRAGHGGRPGPTDTIPALLSPGEAVLSVKHTRQLAPMLAAAGVPGFAGGGFAELKHSSRAFSELLPMLQAREGTLARTAEQIQGITAPGSGGLAGAIARSPDLAMRFAALQRSGYISPQGEILKHFLPGFAAGGAVGRSQSVNVGDIHVSIGSSGSSAVDGAAIGRSIRRSIQRGILSGIDK